MKSLCALIAAVAASTAMAADIPVGTHLLLRMEHSISTRTAQPGDGVHMRTATPINVGGRLAVPIGSYAQGVVVRAERARRAHGSATLEIRLQTLFLPSGAVIEAPARSASLNDEPNRRTSRASSAPFVLAAILIGLASGSETGARIGVGAAGGAIMIPAIVGRGREIELRQGATLDVMFEQPVPLRE